LPLGIRTEKRGREKRVRRRTTVDILHSCGITGITFSQKLLSYREFGKIPQTIAVAVPGEGGPARKV
jgi:hypothetical protein